MPVSCNSSPVRFRFGEIPRRASALQSSAVATDWTIGSDLSQQCHYVKHQTCAHWMGLETNVIKMLRGQGPEAILCQCICHEECPVAGVRTVEQSQWMSACTCPGSGPVKDIMANAQRPQRRRRS